MSSQFPGARDVFGAPIPGVTKLNDALINHPVQHINLGDGLGNVQDKLGYGTVGNANQLPSANTALLGVGAGQSSYGQITNAYIANAAAIAYSKLALTNSLITGDLVADAVTEKSKTTLGSAFSTTSTTVVAVTGMATTINPAGGITYYVWYACSGTVQNNALGGFTVIQILVDGSATGNAGEGFQFYAANAQMGYAISQLLGPFTGSHTFGLGTLASSGSTASVAAAYQSILTLKK